MTSLPQEIIDEINANATKFNRFAEDILITNFKDLDLYIIKCHLIVENELNNAIDNVTKHRMPMEVANFTFSQKIKLAELLGYFDHEKSRKIRDFLVKLNKLRNHIAHKLTYNVHLLNEITDFENNFSEDKFKTPENYYKYILNYLIGYYSGSLTYIAKLIQLKSVADIIGEVERWERRKA